ncbi:tol-pal system-associated acyl-CoA thioesterase [Rhodobacter sp. NTK016B]|uniref:tol-pal system-associated acyl-CoA thioesterase n=1 Tax=Rhodobacter sp. NTK016B TaxID=2759676 RepID=UPI001A8F9AA2|nr:tol-pal system-associated acyl-CoA thioesterase [Rhodobacter sp. NTK016B]MBN8294430.1 tol-pal system-associated acyl-CoA thioesterase [Rhodobacter sp. NTK016B]
MHRYPVTVHYEDTDLGGIVYHANYLKFIERARSDWVRALGIDQVALRREGVIFAVHHIEAWFQAPATLDEQLSVHTSVIEAGVARLVLDQQVYRGETCLFRAQVTLVSMTTEGKPRRLPKEVRALSGNT